MESNQREKRQDLKRQAIILASLLHDIGKFVQRAQENPREQKHTWWGRKWFERNLAEKIRKIFGKLTDEISSMINSHHEGVEYIFLADALSAGMERIALDMEEEGDFSNERLISVFSRISISDKPKVNKYYQLTPLGEGGNTFKELFPIDDSKCSWREYKKLLDKFNAEIKNLEFTSAEQVIKRLYFLLWKYTWCIPSAVYRNEPDIPLFDHLKTTAAIATCLYDYEKYGGEKANIDTTAFLVVGGDISGIQSYIFDVLAQQGKVAKRLRARSFFIQLISHIASYKVLHTFNLSLCNEIISTGGNFYILLPNLKDAKGRLNRIHKEFDYFTLEEMSGEVSVNLEYMEISGRDLFNFSKVLENLKKKVLYSKYQPHKSLLVEDGKWVEDKFIRKKVIRSEEKICSGCHKDSIYEKEVWAKEEGFCKRCFEDVEVGKLLVESKYIIFSKTFSEKYRIFDYSFGLEKTLQKHDAYLVLTLNDTDSATEGDGFKYITNYVPTDKSGVLTFEDIAKKSCGEKILGYFKADVDNMGLIITHGFLPRFHCDENGEDCQICKNKFNIKNIKPSISRLSSFSRMLDAFFAGFLQAELKENYSNFYTVFSGGDDMFIVGPWNEIIDFSVKIRKLFRKFCADNPDITFSAGIGLFKHYEPISFCTREVENALKNSKKIFDEKDKITIFNKTMSWDDLENVVLTEAKRIIENWLKKQPPLISRNLIYNFKKYGEMYEDYLENQDIKSLKFIPLLVYDVNRNLNKPEQEEIKKWIMEAISNFQKSQNKKLLFLRVIMEYVLIYTGGGKNGENM